ncbi:MFS transporter [Modestobacter sp. NPDC049651]|uniref:MFS transporter n=1 Tax=unclassified Modestobacter TaxID=2643866 RepID=UPI0033F26E27
MTRADETVSAPGTRGRAATRATYLAFAGAGFAFASWASRIPQVRDELELTPARLGLALLAIAAGSVVSLPLAGPLIHRIGSRRAVTAMVFLLAAALVAVGVGHSAGIWALAVALFVMGFANGAWDVGMNVQGAVVERLIDRPIMARFHAGYSIGTVAGALVGAAMVALDVPVAAHLVAVAVVIVAVVPAGVRAFVPDVDEASAPTGERHSALAAWREPRTLLVGVFVLAFAFAEGTANDWTSVALIDGYGVSEAVGTLGFAVFLAAMTGVRWIGPGLLDRYGRVAVVRATAVAAVVGLVLFVFGGSAPVAFLGALLWGAGASLGFPVGMSAAADDPVRAASRVSVVASIGYCAFLAGPPLIGFLGQHSSVLHGLTVVAVLMAVATLIAGTLRPPAEVDGPG